MTLVKSFEMGIAYARVYVVNADDPDATTLYFEEQHYRQGFAWSPHDAEFDVDLSFRLRELECIGGLFEVHLADQIELAPDSERAILLPFTVGKEGIYVCDVGSHPTSISIPEGHYALLFELKERDDPEYLNSAEYQHNLEGNFIEIWCRLTFVPQEVVEPAILRVDEYLSPTYPLLMEAEPNQ
jgi:hypothetical protein